MLHGIRLFFRSDVDGGQVGHAGLHLALNFLDQVLCVSHRQIIDEIGTDRHEHGIGRGVDRAHMIDRADLWSLVQNGP